MPPNQPIDPNHESTRGLLRTIGPLLAVVGGIFMLVGFVDFFGAINSGMSGMDGNGPTLFWCLFVGMPLLGVGLTLTKIAYFGKIARYMSEEITPVATDTFNYAATHTQEGIREVARAIGEGLQGSTDQSSVNMVCVHCRHENGVDAQFCSGCGKPLPTRRACPICHEHNAPDARFCDHCGSAL